LRTENTHVSTRAVKLAIVLDVEVDNVDRAAPVVLDDLVGRMVSAATDDPAVSARLVVLDAECIFADVLPPYEFQRAVAGAVDSFGLVLADDHVAQRGAFAQVEDCVFPVCIAFSFPGDRIGEMVFLPPSVCELHAPLPRSYLYHWPSNTWPAAISITALLVFVPTALGTPPVCPLQAKITGRNAAIADNVAKSLMLKDRLLFGRIYFAEIREVKCSSEGESPYLEPFNISL
jgi:hypothetical protein